MSKFRAIAAAAIALPLFLAFFFTVAPPLTIQAQEPIVTAAGVGSAGYVMPARGAVTASAGTTIAIRPGLPIDAGSVQADAFTVSGARSGEHNGRARLARDGVTVIFQPDTSFVPGETVMVTVQRLRAADGSELPPVQWTFTVSAKPYPYADVQDTSSEVLLDMVQSSGAQPSPRMEIAATSDAASLFVTPPYVTAPNFRSGVAITQTGAALGEGLVFIAPNGQGRAATIFDSEANLVYYRPESGRVFDFKRQPNGLLTYFDSDTNSFTVLDNTYTVVDTWTAGNGLVADLHEFLLLPNGHALFMIYDRQPVDLSGLGGRSDAIVIDLVLQELDQDKNVVFEWNSRNHIPFTDTFEPLNTAVVDYAHGNAIEVDTDGNLLISSRHLSEITKIDRATGAIIWRLGGKNNQFTFIGDPTLPSVGGFSYQHDIRRLANGHITIFDNGNQFYAANLRASRGVEYALDEAAKTATLVQEFRTVPDVVSLFMGSMQRLANGNTFIGWGGGTTAPPVTGPADAATEFAPGGQIALSLDFLDPTARSYRAHRFPWQGFPATPPVLVAVTGTLPVTGPITGPISLYYSWNGATEVFSYSVAAGATPDKLTTVAVQPKTGFEEVTPLADRTAEECFYQVTPYDKAGQPQAASNLVHLGDAVCASTLSVAPQQAKSRTFPVPGATGATSVTVSINDGVVLTPTVFVFQAAPQADTNPPAGKIWGGFVFQVQGYTIDDSGRRASAAADPVYLTVDYRNLALPHVTTLSLAIWDPVQQAWSVEGMEVLANDTVRRQMTVSAPRPGIFAVLAENQTPTSSNMLFLTTEDTPYTFRPADFPYSDGDGDPIQSIVIETAPGAGVLQLGETPISSGQVITAGVIAELVFVPARDGNGIPYTTFTFRVNDGYAASEVYTATMLVRPVDELLYLPAVVNQK